MPDILGIRALKYEDMPTFDSQNEISLYALWNMMWGRDEFECYIDRELVPTEGHGHSLLSTACRHAESYYLFSAYREWDMLTEDRGDEQGVFARVKLIFEGVDLDREAMAEALEYVMKNPAPEGGFTSAAAEREYVRDIHDFIATKVSYSPIGYDPNNMVGSDRYVTKQEAYTALGEDQYETVCAGYARALALIAHYAGIDVAWVWGNETDSSSHAWNVLYPCDGGEPVLIDLTWDDTDSFEDGVEYVDYTWFYTPLSEVYDHEADAGFEAFLEYLHEQLK